MNFELMKFINLLQEQDHLDQFDLFNPYTDQCPFNDVRQAPLIRMSNLVEYLKILGKTNTLLVGEAPGYLGCRRTGLPFTDEETINQLSKIYKHTFNFQKATFRGEDEEHSARFMTGELINLENPPFVWNIVPFHPYKHGRPLSNRKPIKKDFEVTESITKYFFEHTSFSSIFAVGKVAYEHLQEMGFEEAVYIRHPSYGGKNDFISGLQKHFIYKPIRLQKNKLMRFLE